MNVFLRVALESFLQAARDQTPLAAFEPWIELASALGPTMRSGPLTHDLLLPARRPRPALGLTVFSHGERDALMRVAAAWSDRWLGSSRALGPLFDAAERWHGGVGARAGAPKLKLYATGAVGELGSMLGVDTRGAIAVGVDVTAGGFERARSYFDAGDERWPALTPATSHRLLTRLGGAEPKTTFSTIFRTDVEANELLQLCEDPALDGALLEATRKLARTHGFVLRAAAHEIDVFGDGRVETDALVTAGAP